MVRSVKTTSSTLESDKQILKPAFDFLKKKVKRTIGRSAWSRRGACQDI